MIEKLNVLDNTRQVVDRDGFTIAMPDNSVIKKINELIDIIEEIDDAITATMDSVNIHEKQIDELQMKLEPEKCEPADPDAEQRKWIGKLCKFWDDSDKPKNCVYDVLCNIFDLHHEDCPFQCGNGEWYEYCEPVSPEDDIIYKKEQQ